MKFHEQAEEASRRDAERLCANCGEDRTEALFACPHCGADGIDIRMNMNEDEVREFEYAQGAARHHARQGFVTALCSVFMPWLWIGQSR